MSQPAKKTLLKHSLRWLLRRVDNLSIKAKLFSYAALLVALMVLLSMLVYYQVNEIRSRHIPARAAARDMEAALLTMRTHELNFINEADSLNAEFYIKQQSVSVNAWRENYRIFEENYKKLAELFKDGAIGEELGSVESLAVQYRDTFLKLNGAYSQRGFQSFGREGVLHQRADTLQASLANNAQLLSLFLKAQESQDKFLLYREQISVRTFHEQAVILQDRLTKTDRVLFDEYVRLFDEVVAIHQRIGLTANDGLRGQLNQLIIKITPHIQTAEAAVLDSTSNSITAIARTLNVTTIGVSIFAVGMAFILARLIIGKIRLLSVASERIAQGELSYRLPVYATDELSKLSASFNIMTERLQANRRTLRERASALSQSVRRFELVSRAVNEAIYEWNIQTDQLTWGEGIVTVFGYKPHNKATTIEWWRQHIHPDDAIIIDTSLSERMYRHAENWKKEYRFKRASGEYVYCQDRGFIEYEDGQPVRMVGSIVDISRQKALDRAKDEFISVASHQLRTPLGSIRWNLELLLEEKKLLSKQLQSYAQEAYGSTLRMLGLVTDLLSVARIEQDRVQNIPEKTDLVVVTKSAVAEMEPIAKHRKVHINSVGLHNKQISIVIDPKRYREVIQNILSNAVKYTSAQGTVTVDIEQRSADALVSVADNGIGIPLEDQSKMFSKFYRASNVLTTETEGSGLGLFVVKSYVESWGGRVWFKSKPDEGTTFYITIPHKPRAPRRAT